MRQTNKIAAMAALLHSTGMTPMERRLGRYLRAPDDHPGAPGGFIPDGGGGAGTGDGNNGGGNSGGDGGGSSNQNNTGADELDPSDFWNDPAPKEEPNPNPAPKIDPNQPNPDGDFANQLVSHIDGLKFDGVFTDEVTQAINQGDYTAANTAITANLKQAVKASMGVQAQLLKRFSDTLVPNIEKRVTDMVNERLGQEKAQDALTQAIPSASNPKVGPGIRAIYNHALTRTGGDTAKALAMTKSMMRTMASEMSGDVDLDVAPRDPHASPRPKPTNWLEELAAAR